VTEARLLVRIGAEGGYLAVYGGPLSTPGSRFRVAVVDQTPTFLNDDEAGPASRKDSGWLASWEEAMSALGRYPWPHLSVLYVHESVRAEVWKAVQDYAATSPSRISSSSMQRWRTHCSENSVSPSEEEWDGLS